MSAVVSSSLGIVAASSRFRPHAVCRLSSNPPSRTPPRKQSVAAAATGRASRPVVASVSIAGGCQLSTEEVIALIEPGYDPVDAQRCLAGDFTPALSDEDVRRSLQLSATQSSFAMTYGEITHEGATELGRLLREHGDVGARDVFYDLGSGLGRAVLQAHLQWGVARAVGVELSRERHAKAERAKAHLEAIGALDPNRRVDFVNDNLLDCDVSDATVVFLCCACWDAGFMRATLETLQARASRLRWIVSVENLERKFGLTPDWIRLRATERVGQTWAPDGYPLYVYGTEDGR